MSSRDRDDALAFREETPGILALPHRYAAPKRLGDLNVVFFVGARAQHDVRARHVLGREALVDRRALPGQRLGQRPATVVGAGHVVTGREEQLSDRRHPRAADADDVDPLQPHFPSARSSRAISCAA